jgi:hypothetical protein
MTNHPDLQQFAKQLVFWTELVIENGRTPFRRVDLYPHIQTEQGVLQPPVIFWINRQSLMAGGILLLPNRDLPAELERGRCCAEALGLRNFVTWEIDRVRIWQLDGKMIKQHREFLFGAVEHPDDFRYLLEELLETLKLLAVTGLIPPNQLSCHYLHNLFLTTLELALPPLLNSYRSQRAQENEEMNGDADRQATEANQLLLLQLLTLRWHQQLPNAILPEKLERAIEISLPQLPKNLQQSLSWGRSAESAALPHETTVCFHHLLLRLRQLSWDMPKERALAALRLLIDGWFPPQKPQGTAQICFYPPTPRLAAETDTLLSDSPSLLAAASLLEQIEAQPIRRQYFGNLFQFTPDTLPQGTIQATLTSERVPGRGDQQQYTSLLRTSWPNRRFRLTTNTPLWQWETIHLLGLFRRPEALTLTLPNQALKLTVDEPFWPLLLENYQLCSIDSSTGQNLVLELIRGTNNSQPIRIKTADNQVQIIPADEIHLLRSQLLLALQLPATLYQLCAEQFIPCGEEHLSATALSGLSIYAGSLLGKRLWRLLSTTPPPVAEADRLALAKNIGWPHPEARVLEELALASKAGGQRLELSDSLLAELLGCTDILEIERPEGSLKKRPVVAENLPGKLLRQQLIQQLQNEGLPTFPEKYLYFLEQPQMVLYQFSPPLLIRNEFLGQCELIDARGKVIPVDGEELTQVLLLCSLLEKTQVELPADRQLVALILEQYCQDLRTFHQHLNELCFQWVENSKAARKLARKTWSELALPPLKWLEAQPQ